MAQEEDNLDHGLLSRILPQPNADVVTPEQWAAFNVPQLSADERTAVINEIRSQTAGVVDLAVNGPGLRHIKDKDGVAVFQGAVEGSPINLVRGVCSCPGRVEDAARIARTVRDTAHLRADFKALDPMNEDSRVVHDLLPHVATNDIDEQMALVCWGSFSVPGPPWSRDFVWGQAYDYDRENQRFIITAGCLENDCGVPDMQGSHRRVRGSILQTGYCLSQKTEEEMEIGYVVQVDPRGMLPTWVVNLVAADQAANAGRMRDRLCHFFAANRIFREIDILQSSATRDLLIPARRHVDLTVTAEADCVLQYAITTPNGTLGVSLTGVENDHQEWARHETGEMPLRGHCAVPAGTTVVLRLDNGFSWKSVKNVFLRVTTFPTA